MGENGSGKSTLVEAIAAASGNNAEGGSRNAMHSSRATESPLHEILRVTRSVGAPTWSSFLRAETMHGHLSYLEDLDDLYEARPGGARARNPLHRMSHGESYLSVFDTYVARPGFSLMDEPESALSFTSCLVLVGVLDELARSGSQVVCASHSPILTALPGATILQVDADGLTEVGWAELDLVDHFRLPARPDGLPPAPAGLADLRRPGPGRTRCVTAATTFGELARDASENRQNCRNHPHEA